MPSPKIAQRRPAAGQVLIAKRFKYIFCPSQGFFLWAHVLKRAWEKKKGFACFRLKNTAGGRILLDKFWC
jgi:hypothetical protein